MTKQTLIALAVSLVIFASPSTAQEATPLVSNSFGVIDNMREVTLSGTIKYVRLVGERSRIQLLVKDEQGGVHEWSLEGPAEGAYMRSDKIDTPFRQYESVTVVIRPIENDSTAGEIVSIVADE